MFFYRIKYVIYLSIIQKKKDFSFDSDMLLYFIGLPFPCDFFNTETLVW